MQFLKHNTFLDITKERPDVVKIVSETLPHDIITKVYECNESRIIHTKNYKTNHASISNSKGYEYIQEWEIAYVIEHILEVDIEDVIMYVSRNSFIHIRVKELSTFIS